MRKKVFIIAVGFLLFLTNLFADTIVLKSGKQIEAQIVKRSEDRVILDIGGVDVPYFLDEIEKINGESINPSPKDESEQVHIQKTELDGEESSKTRENSGETSNSGSSFGGVGVKGELQQKGGGVSGREEGDIRLSITASLIILFLIISIYIYSSICLQFIAKKTNQSPAWLAWIPVANLFLMCKIAKISYWWLLLILGAFIPYLGIVCGMFFTGFIWYKIALARNRPGWIGVLAIIPLVNLFIMGYLAFLDQITN